MSTDSLLALNIGELIVSDRPVVISTVLGSCVSVCLFNPDMRVGGMIHYALPYELRPSESEKERLRYGEFSLPLLVERVRALAGSLRAPLQAKLAGGAAVISSSVDIGGENVRIARKLLAEFAIPVVGEDVGGILGRRLHFHTATGRLQVAPIVPSEARGA